MLLHMYVRTYIGTFNCTIYTICIFYHWFNAFFDWFKAFHIDLIGLSDWFNVLHLQLVLYKKFAFTDKIECSHLGLTKYILDMSAL